MSQLILFGIWTLSLPETGDRQAAVLLGVCFVKGGV